MEALKALNPEEVGLVVVAVVVVTAPCLYRALAGTAGVVAVVVVQPDLLPSEQKVDLVEEAAVDHIPEQAETAVLVEAEGLLGVKLAHLQYPAKVDQVVVEAVGQALAPVYQEQVAQAS